MKKSIKFIAGATLTLMFYFIITSYGNTKIHRGLNALMINRFEDNFITSSSSLTRFKNYIVLLKSERLYKGEAIVNSGYLDVDSETRKYPAYKWIQEGGFSADEPEIFASFRHFYDPTKDEGDRYLHDHLDYLDSKGIANQPEIDHIEWALNHPMHQYNWENAKAAVMSAFSSPDNDFKNEEMAFAYRALGETLHMIADMGCPAHVRDDAHASKSIAGYKLGSPDMYEEYAELFDVSSFDITKVDPNLKASFRSSEATVESIAKTLAEYTNENFFTGQTIYGKDKDDELVEPIIHADAPYKLPDLDDCTYDFSTIGYYKKISGQEVLMCRDHYYSRFYKGYPYIDRACVESQAKVLFPQIVEAGANVIRLFIPNLEIEITDFTANADTIKGKVSHKPDNEYKKEIKYNGTVSIFDAKTMKLITEVKCIDGKFEEEIKPKDFKKVDWDKGIYAEIIVGSISIKSEPFTGVTLPFSRISINGKIGILAPDGSILKREDYVHCVPFNLFAVTDFTTTKNKIRIDIDSTSSSNAILRDIRSYPYGDVQTLWQTGFVEIEYNGKELGAIEYSITTHYKTCYFPTFPTKYYDYTQTIYFKTYGKYYGYNKNKGVISFSYAFEKLNEFAIPENMGLFDELTYSGPYYNYISNVEEISYNGTSSLDCDEFSFYFYPPED